MKYFTRHLNEGGGVKDPQFTHMDEKHADMVRSRKLNNAEYVYWFYLLSIWEGIQISDEIAARQLGKGLKTIQKYRRDMEDKGILLIERKDYGNVMYLANAEDTAEDVKSYWDAAEERLDV